MSGLISCYKCGSENLFGALYCVNCGVNMPQIKPEPQSIRIGNTVIRKDRIEAYEVRQEIEVTELLDHNQDLNITTTPLETVAIYVYSMGREYAAKSQEPDCDLIKQLDEILGV